MRTLITIILVAFSFLFGSAQEKEEKPPVRDGKYYEYWDKDSTRISACGHFCNGKPCKKWKYFHYNGKRRMKSKYGDRIKLKYYRENGRRSEKGYAVLDRSSKAIHFYWQGKWKYYNKKGRLYRVVLFEKGEELKVISGPEEPYYFE